MAEPTPNRINWIDIETTGLDQHTDLLLEVGIVVTDDQLEVLDSASMVIGHFTEDLDARLGRSEHAKAMHTGNGLYDACVNSLHSVSDARRMIHDVLTRNNSVGAVVGGSSVAFDRSFLDVYMPRLNRELLHYRSIDTSSFKEIVRRVNAPLFASVPDFPQTHRVLDCLAGSIGELKHYLSALTEGDAS